MKECIDCHETKPLENFCKDKSRADGHYSRCKECKRSKQRKYYQENKPSYNAKTKECRDRRKALARQHAVSYLLQHPCVDCGESDIMVLEFDHIRGTKIDGVGRLVHDGYSIEVIQEEIDKCEVRCCKCHRKVTFLRAGVDFAEYL